MWQFWQAVLVPILFGSVMISLNTLLRRKILKDGQLSVLQFLIVSDGLACLLCASGYLAIWGARMPHNLLPKFWTAVFGGAIANFVIQFLNAKAASYDKGEVSLTAPLQAMTPFLITVLALTLGEFPSRTGCLGVFLMICGSYVLLWERNPEHWYDYLGPLRRLRLLLRFSRLNADERSKTLVVCLSLGSAAMGTVGLLFDGLYTRRGVNMQGLVIATVAFTGLMSGAYASWYLLKPDSTPGQRADFLTAVFGRKFALLVLLFAITWALQAISIQSTFNKSFVAYVGTLKRFHIFFSVILGYWLFREAEFKKRLWASVLIILGAIFISMDGLATRIATKVEILGF